MSLDFDAKVYACILDELIIMHMTGNEDAALEFAAEQALLFPLETETAIRHAGAELRSIQQFHEVQ